jgi:hypothetical protein
MAITQQAPPLLHGLTFLRGLPVERTPVGGGMVLGRRVGPVGRCVMESLAWARAQGLLAGQLLAHPLHILCVRPLDSHCCSCSPLASNLQVPEPHYSNFSVSGNDRWT